MNVTMLIAELYVLWSIYSGYKIISGRSAWLDERKPLNFICKLALGTVMGIMVAGINFKYLLLKLLNAKAKM